MIVLSLFDGLSCGQIALERAGIPVEKYYASEIDKYAIKVTQHNYPNTIQIGDVRNVKGNELGWLDMIIGGSPCTGFSVAGGGLNFEHPESILFFEYIRILKEAREINPDVLFLLENVKMKKEWENIISKLIGCRPCRFNSSLVSAQTRSRLYWTNIPVNTIPKNKHIYLSDIIEHGTTDRSKSYCIDANYYKGGNKKSYEEKSRRQLVSQSTRRDVIKTHNLQPRNGKSQGGKGPLERDNGKAYCVDTNNGQAIEYDNVYRKLTVKECCRLQTVPDNYFEGIVSNTQAYKMLGNGWTIDIVAHIFKHIK